MATTQSGWDPCAPVDFSMKISRVCINPIWSSSMPTRAYFPIFKTTDIADFLVVPIFGYILLWNMSAFSIFKSRQVEAYNNSYFNTAWSGSPALKNINYPVTRPPAGPICSIRTMPPIPILPGDLIYTYYSADSIITIGNMFLKPANMSAIRKRAIRVMTIPNIRPAD